MPLMLKCIFLLSWLITPSHAAPSLTWTCQAVDQYHQKCKASAAYEKAAKMNALAECKAHSQNPKGCVVSSQACEATVHGFHRQPLWRCTALDRQAKAVFGVVSKQRNAAALSAKEQCESQSNEPDSCYVNLLTCKNLNEQH